MSACQSVILSWCPENRANRTETACDRTPSLCHGARRPELEQNRPKAYDRTRSPCHGSQRSSKIAPKWPMTELYGAQRTAIPTLPAFITPNAHAPKTPCTFGPAPTAPGSRPFCEPNTHGCDPLRVLGHVALSGRGGFCHPVILSFCHSPKRKKKDGCSEPRRAHDRMTE